MFESRGYGIVGPITHHTQVADGNEGALQTVDIIKKLIREGVKSYLVRKEALLAIQDVSERNIGAQIDAIHRWVQRRYKYVRDPYLQETLLTPERIIRQRWLDNGYGIDCDDFVILESALLQSVGIPTDIVVAACSKHRPNEYSHIYLRAYNHKTNKWIPLDPTCKERGMGWQPKSFSKKIIKFNRIECDGALRNGSENYIPKPDPYFSTVAVKRMFRRPSGSGMGWHTR